MGFNGKTREIRCQLMKRGRKSHEGVWVPADDSGGAFRTGARPGVFSTKAVIATAESAAATARSCDLCHNHSAIACGAAESEAPSRPLRPNQARLETYMGIAAYAKTPTSAQRPFLLARGYVLTRVEIPRLLVEDPCRLSISPPNSHLDSDTAISVPSI
ncbi:hypothetical protein VUR80DRAFT_1368 [Thermomyces stellatus]